MNALLLALFRMADTLLARQAGQADTGKTPELLIHVMRRKPHTCRRYLLPVTVAPSAALTRTVSGACSRSTASVKRAQSSYTPWPTVR